MKELDKSIGALLDEYLANLLISGNKRKAAQCAGMTYAQVYAFRKENPEFAEREREAILTRSARIVETIENQALYGVREYIFDKNGDQIFYTDENNEKKPAFRIKLEPTIRLAMLRRHDPGYREDKAVEDKKTHLTGVLAVPREMTIEEFEKYVAEKSRE